MHILSAIISIRFFSSCKNFETEPSQFTIIIWQVVNCIQETLTYIEFVIFWSVNCPMYCIEKQTLSVFLTNNHISSKISFRNSVKSISCCLHSEACLSAARPQPSWKDTAWEPSKWICFSNEYLPLCINHLVGQCLPFQKPSSQIPFPADCPLPSDWHRFRTGAAAFRVFPYGIQPYHLCILPCI